MRSPLVLRCLHPIATSSGIGVAPAWASGVAIDTHLLQMKWGLAAAGLIGVVTDSTLKHPTS